MASLDCCAILLQRTLAVFLVIRLLVCWMRLPIWMEEQFILWLITCAHSNMAPETANYIKEENQLEQGFHICGVSFTGIRQSFSANSKTRVNSEE